VLANRARDGLEGRLRAAFARTTIRDRGAKVNRIRYADDVVSTGSSRALREVEVKPRVARFRAERGLELAQEQTRITRIADGCDCVGQTLRKYQRGQQENRLITPSQAHGKAFLGKVRARVKAHQHAPAGELIRCRTPRMRGWAR